MNTTDEFWENVVIVDLHLDRMVDQVYKDQPIAQDWARVAKVIEELGETIGELILHTGQNPRKGRDDQALGRMLSELADVACTAILGTQHFTKDWKLTRNILESRMNRIRVRALEWEKEFRFGGPEVPTA